MSLLFLCLQSFDFIVQNFDFLLLRRVQFLHLFTISIEFGLQINFLVGF